MRAYRRRPWASLTVNMTPLIDVVFLIIIFFIIMINFSEMFIREVNLPKADEARHSKVDRKLLLPIIIKSDDMVFLKGQQIDVSLLSDTVKRTYPRPENYTIQIRADENVSYQVINRIMRELALLHIDRIEFSTWKEEPEPIGEGSNDEA